MSLFALATWITAAAFGLYLLSIWLIEYDRDFQSTAATRLPSPVLAAHVLFACGGLAVWIAYLIFDADRLAWAAIAALVIAVTLGTVMAVRWVGVHRAGRAALRAHKARLTSHLTLVSGATPAEVAVLERPREVGPPERNFPLPVVIAHGAFAAVTITLVLLTALGGS
jgi:hypothetical protein